ncbi:MAG TPA: hypothetical protein VD846_01170 [Allosphingosinicella sp.]|nr:hypothetical protein [Allosphingosinicella sp.]
MKAVLPLLTLPVLLAACAPASPRVEAPSPAALRTSAAVAEQVRRCYRAPRVPSTGRGIVTRLFARYTADGILVGLPLLVSQQGVTAESRPYASRMAEAAKLAVIRCSPVRLPPRANKKRGSDFVLTFSPRRTA